MFWHFFSHFLHPLSSTKVVFSIMLLSGTFPSCRSQIGFFDCQILHINLMHDKFADIAQMC